MADQRSLLKIFVKKGLLEESKLDEILKFSKEHNLSVDQVVTQKGYLEEKEFLKTFSDEYGYRFAEKLDSSEVPEDFCQKIPINHARTYYLIDRKSVV